MKSDKDRELIVDFDRKMEVRETIVELNGADLDLVSGGFIRICGLIHVDE